MIACESLYNLYYKPEIIEVQFNKLQSGSFPHLVFWDFLADFLINFARVVLCLSDIKQAWYLFVLVI